MTTEHEIEYTLADGRVVCVRFEAEYNVVDNGIGAYEYWGAKGRDVRLEHECEVVSINDIVDEDDNSVEVSKDEMKAIEQKAYDYAVDNAPEYDGSDDGYYDDPRDWD